MTDFPTTPEQVSPQRLTAYLRHCGCLADATVTSCDYKLIGTGKMGDNARFNLAYDGPAPAAPGSLIAKFPAADDHARAMAGAQGAYYNEVMFYRELAPGTRMRTPTIYASELSEDRTEFLLLMEDMSPAEPGSNLLGESRQHSELALAQAAKLAGAYYDDQSLASRDYVLTPARDDGAAFGQALLEQSWPGFVDRFGHGMSQQAIAFGERYVGGHAYFANRFQGPKTLVHGDFRSENILFGPDCATTVDWQTTSESSPLTDAAYFMGGSIKLEDRRDWERDLIEKYRQCLELEGVSLSGQDCWDQYREQAIHGLLITVLGASFSTPDERGDKMFLSMIQGHLQHCIDLGADEFLPT